MGRPRAFPAHARRPVPVGEKTCRRRGGGVPLRKRAGPLHARGAPRWQTESAHREAAAPAETSAVKSTTNGPFVRQEVRRPIHLGERTRATIRDFSLERVFGATFRKHLPLCCRETIERGRRDHHRRQCRHHRPGPLPGPHRAGACDERSHESRGAQALPAGPTSRHPGGQLRTHRPAAPGHRSDQGLGAAARIPAVDAGDRPGGRALQHLLRRAPAHGAGAQGLPAP